VVRERLNPDLLFSRNGSFRDEGRQVKPGAQDLGNKVLSTLVDGAKRSGNHILATDTILNDGVSLPKRVRKAPTTSSSSWYYHANSPVLRITDSVAQHLKREFPRGEVRTGYGSEAVHLRQKEGCHRLPSCCWPRISGKPAWPSSPSLNEKLDMLRRGIKDTYPDHIVGGSFTSIRLREFNSNIELVKRTISRAVIGVRSDIAVPVKYWKYFCYRWNFLILSVAGAMPSGLARFLASIWLRDPYSLWLERRVTLKQYLRELPLSVYNRGVAAFSAHQSDWYADEDSPFTSDADSLTSSQLD
jgi:hypothetical protein